MSESQPLCNDKVAIPDKVEQASAGPDKIEQAGIGPDKVHANLGRAISSVRTNNKLCTHYRNYRKKSQSAHFYIHSSYLMIRRETDGREE